MHRQAKEDVFLDYCPITVVDVQKAMKEFKKSTSRCSYSAAPNERLVVSAAAQLENVDILNQIEASAVLPLLDNVSMVQFHG